LKEGGNMPKEAEKIEKGLKYKILVVDDEQDLLKFFERILGFEEYSVITAHNGLIGIKKNLEHDPDLILLDLTMPGMHGIEMLRKVRKVDKDVIVIILTGSGDTESVREAADLNVYEYISKPTTLDVLKRVIKKALASRKKKSSE
jgi:DNA-binding NtrC family response regulator